MRMNQKQRRVWLIRALLEEMPQYQYPVFPYTPDRQWRLLRSLMNVRPPMPVTEEFLQVQDAFLRDCGRKKPAALRKGQSACPLAGGRHNP